MKFTFRLAPPPSTNALFFNLHRKGRRKTKKYKGWIRDADCRYFLQKLHHVKIEGPYTVDIKMPPGRKDVDNCGKAIIDWMVSRNLTDDDKNLRKYTIGLADVGECIITVESLDECGSAGADSRGTV